MDIFSLFLLYYLTQKPALLESIKPLAQLLKNSEESLKLLENLKAFTAIFDSATAQSATQTVPSGQSSTQSQTTQTEQGQTEFENKNRQSPFQGIADEILQQYLDEYLNGNTKP